MKEPLNSSGGVSPIFEGMPELVPPAETVCSSRGRADCLTGDVEGGQTATSYVIAPCRCRCRGVVLLYTPGYSYTGLLGFPRKNSCRGYVEYQLHTIVERSTLVYTTRSPFSLCARNRLLFVVFSLLSLYFARLFLGPDPSLAKN